MPQMTVNKTKSYTVPEGVTLMEALRSADILLDAPCGGNGKCGKCRVTARGALSEKDGSEAALSPEADRRLACRAVVLGDCEVQTEAPDSGAVIVSGGYCADFVRDAGRCGFGAAVDIGTTTVVCYIYDLATGRQVCTKSGMNRQRAFGADVISRTQYTVEHPDGLDTLSGVIREQLNEYLSSAPERVCELTVAGNTIMQHIFAGLPPKGIAVAPFTPVSLFGSYLPADTLGLNAAEGARVFLSPCVAGYVGGDITAGLLSSGAYLSEKPTLFLDIGTNGEIALGGRDGFVCCAAASGPAFEGAEIEHGMSGVEGAINRVWLENGDIKFSVIGGGRPKGICGSGLIDALAVLLETELVDYTGRMSLPDGKLWLDRESDLYISQADVRKLQLAKSAIAAGIRTLMDECGLKPTDISSLCLAGGFGSYLDPKNAAVAGLFPSELLPVIRPVGNSAGAGASALLLSSGARRELDKISEKCKYIELSGSAEFNRHFIDYMFFGD